MKVVIISFILVVVGLYLAFHFGGIGSLDPAQQAEQLKADVTPGMTWQEVADKRPPKRYQTFVQLEDGSIREAPEVKFDRGEFDAAFKASGYPLGFNFVYIFGAESQYSVAFDPEGKVTSVDKLTTLGDLLAK